MTRQFLLLLTLLFSLSGPAMGEYSDFGRSSNAARGTDIIKSPTSLTGNYRARYLKADPGLPDGWQVHHSIPQKYQQSFADLGIDVGDMQFLRGVDPKIHSRITTEWGRFDARFGGNPSPADVSRFSKQIDETFGDSLRIPGF